MRYRFYAVVITLATLVSAPGPAYAQLSAPQPVAAQLAPPRADGATGLRDVIGTTVQDFGRLSSKETLTILSVGGVAAVLGHALDREVTRSMSGSQSLGTVFSAGETIGGAREQLAGALATYTIGRIIDSPRVTTVGAALIRAQLVTQAITAGIKLSVGRDRPDGTQYSFPSGHASVTFATATVLQRNLGWKVGVPAYGLATYVAASRVQVKRHFLSDVAFGAAIGIVAGHTVTIGRGAARFAVSPAAVPGGGGLSFTLLEKR